MKRVYVNPEVCIGCKLCELACLTEHSQSKDLIIAYREERMQGLLPRNTVEESGWITASLNCRHCAEPYCIQACISGALTKDAESGRVVYEEEQCVGCWSCLMACPFGAIKRHPIKEKIVKCDLCPERSIPACVSACPNQALTFEEK
ncbi:MAG TPA: 4Fe-4S dicluster domain-containing protein [Desulfonauticus sp.]|jgi:carbon-monoxide dehydrogenase iron sulfur subunit|nr:MAG: 4Fe-4S ferredoxin iron-sulfur binding domain-containing protein [Desulfonauticus sp. 38_4375]MDK2922010.1 anaerobic carbon-monoxide dehydrogenase iron sulfur subunit [Desulfonauticus sp.]HCO11627.1 4Fe-4S dicluster domain-containing protein [Desulfonauticus sp.]